MRRLLRSGRGVVAVACAWAATGCCEITGTCNDDDDKERCTSEQITYSNTFNTYLTNGAPVARFDLRQDFTRYAAACTETSGGPISLSIVSTAPIPLRFDYSLEGLGATGLLVWRYVGTINRIAPGQRIDVGQVASTPVRVDVAARATLAGVVSVP
jgi:hypothetical protein